MVQFGWLGSGSDGVVGLMGLWVGGAMDLAVVVCGGCRWIWLLWLRMEVCGGGGWMWLEGFFFFLFSAVGERERERKNKK